jgi:hypothetical protein
MIPGPLHNQGNADDDDDDNLEGHDVERSTSRRSSFIDNQSR